MRRKISVLRRRTGEAEWVIIDRKIRARRKGGRAESREALLTLVRVVRAASGAPRGTRKSPANSAGHQKRSLLM